MSVRDTGDSMWESLIEWNNLFFNYEAAQMHLIVFSRTRLYGESNLAHQLKLKQCSDVLEFFFLINKLYCSHL